MKQNKYFTKLKNDYDEASYEYIDKYKLNEPIWEYNKVGKNENSYEFNLIRKYVLFKRATKSIENDTDILEKYGLPYTLEPIFNQFHYLEFLKFFRFRNLYLIERNEYKLLEINNWIKNIEYHEDLVDYFKKNSLNKQLLKHFLQLDFIITISIELPCDIPIMRPISLIKNNLDLFHIVYNKIEIHRQKWLVPNIQEYEYWYWFDDKPVIEHIRYMMRGE